MVEVKGVQVGDGQSPVTADRAKAGYSLLGNRRFLAIETATGKDDFLRRLAFPITTSHP